MESQPQNLEFRINTETFHPCIYLFVGVDASHLSLTTIFQSCRDIVWVEPVLSRG